MEETYLNNFSYLFVPFTTERLEQFPAFCEKVSHQEGWVPADTENLYLHRYVSEKLTMPNDSRRYHFRLDTAFAAKQGLKLGEMLYGTGPKTYKGETTQFPFAIANVELFVFHTAVCILAFELRFQEEDPKKIAAAQYHLRKISLEKIRRLDAPEGAAPESFAEISKRLLGNSTKDAKLDFFFYTAQGNERANCLTYIDIPEKKNYDEDLFYLKWCYHDGFDYAPDCDNEDSEDYCANKNATWGITVAAAVCLVRRNEAQKRFIENSFQKNFRGLYLLTYVLLLHQKYMMYLFLTKMSAGLEGNLSQLEEYKAMLYDFETHYMFSYISEVPQYQRFYAKVRKVFALDALFRDVQEPLSQLAEIKKELAENEQRKHDDRINTVLTTLSLLTVVSALTDATGLTANLGWLIPPLVAKIIQLVALTGVAVASGIMLIRLMLAKKRKKK